MGRNFFQIMGLGRNKLMSWQGEDGEGPLVFSDVRISGDEAEEVETAGRLCPRKGQLCLHLGELAGRL